MLSVQYMQPLKFTFLLVSPCYIVLIECLFTYGVCFISSSLHLSFGMLFNNYHLPVNLWFLETMPTRMSCMVFMQTTAKEQQKYFIAGRRPQCRYLLIQTTQNDPSYNNDRISLYNSCFTKKINKIVQQFKIKIPTHKQTECHLPDNLWLLYIVPAMVRCLGVMQHTAIW